MVGHGGSSIGSYLADPTFPPTVLKIIMFPFKHILLVNIKGLGMAKLRRKPSNPVVILFKSVPVQQRS